MNHLLQKVLICLIGFLLFTYVEASNIGDSCSGSASACDTPGHYCDSTCKLAPEGAFSTGTGLLTQVSTGHFASIDGSTYASSAATQQVPCALGTFKSSAGAGACVGADAGSCAASSGDSCVTSGAVKQVECPQGTYSDAGAGACLACGAGYTSTGSGAGAGATPQVACVCASGYGR